MNTLERIFGLHKGLKAALPVAKMPIVLAPIAPTVETVTEKEPIMTKTTIDNSEGLKRFAKVSNKIYFRLTLGSQQMTVPVEKGKFLKALDGVTDKSVVSAEFDGEITTILL